MGTTVAPKLKKQRLPIGKLLFDPNNPRLTTRDEDQNKEEDFVDNELQNVTRQRLAEGDGKDEYKIKELENSIKQNGWIPVDFIFVRKHSDGQHYVVLEGNRRLAAIQNIRNDKQAGQKLKDSLKEIDVMEIVDNGSPEELKRQISYLLGVRHHGSLKRWMPFSQAHNIYERYLTLSGQDSSTFSWDEDIGSQIASALSIAVDEVKQRLIVYRGMAQIGEMPEVKNSSGGMKGRYYSVCQEVLLAKGNKLSSYIQRDQKTFLLTDESLKRMNNLCHFSSPARSGAPIRNPQEWRPLEKILKEEDTNRREQLLTEVEVEKRPPSEVWAKRAAEIHKLQWDKWLLKVNTVIKTVTLGDDLTSEKSVETVSRLISLISELDNRDIGGQGA